MLPTSAGVEPATSWSPVGRASNWATEAPWKCINSPESQYATSTNFCIFKPRHCRFQQTSVFSSQDIAVFQHFSIFKPRHCRVFQQTFVFLNQDIAKPFNKLSYFQAKTLVFHQMFVFLSQDTAVVQQIFVFSSQDIVESFNYLAITLNQCMMKSFNVSFKIEDTPYFFFFFQQFLNHFQSVII